MFQFKCFYNCVPYLFLTMVSVAPTDAGSPLRRAEDARRLMRSGDFQVAVKAYREVVEQNPYDGTNWHTLASALYRSKNYTGSIAAYKSAIRLGVQPAGSMYNIACCYALQNKSDDALNWLQRSIEEGCSMHPLITGRVLQLQTNAFGYPRT